LDPTRKGSLLRGWLATPWANGGCRRAKEGGAHAKAGRPYHPLSFSPTLYCQATPLAPPLPAIYIVGHVEEKRHKNLSNPPLSRMLFSPECGSSKGCARRESTPPVSRGCTGISIQKIYFRNINWIKMFMSCCQHRTCVKPTRCGTDGNQSRTRRLNTTLWSATSSTTSTMF
jgi:hypothetical protein